MSTDKAVVKSVIQVGFLKCFPVTKRVNDEEECFNLVNFSNESSVKLFKWFKCLKNYRHFSN